VSKAPPFKYTPDRLREEPPADRYCDLILNGGVASGVVYPWALLKLARHYRFRSIGGNSVGAMAAAMAAAAEYGRCHGVADAFEPLRRMPLELAEEELDTPQPRTRMLRLFRPGVGVKRLFDLFLKAVRLLPGQPGQASARGPMGFLRDALALFGGPFVLFRVLVLLAALLAATAGLALVLGLAQGLAWLVDGWQFGPPSWRSGVAILLLASGALLAAVGALALALWVAARAFWRDLHALAAHGYGLCTGMGKPGEEGLVQWLHRGIQLSAGRGEQDAPLSFADLWSAPRGGRPGPAPLPGGRVPPEPAIELQMYTSNVTQGRPVRLPFDDVNTRLFFDPTAWEGFFPKSVVDALRANCTGYQPQSTSDPDPARPLDSEQQHLMATLLELPGGDLPIVVAARLSLCFPVLFACVPVYAIDYETKPGQRRLRQCLLSDGGLCTNFPIHLFDAAHPPWPTFALQLDNRLRNFEDQDRWLPKTHLEGRGDNWQRSVPGAEDPGTGPRPLAGRLLGLAGGIVLTMKDWNDRVTGRLPQVRNRTIRIALKAGEGQLNLDMPRETILRMAHVYGTRTGEDLVERFAPDNRGVKRAWQEHLYVRSIIELRALRSHLAGYTQAVRARGHTMPLREVLDAAVHTPPLGCRPDRRDPYAAALTPAQRQALERAVQAVETLEAELATSTLDLGPYEPMAEPEVRLRPPL